jgi:hypothetical protein
MIILALLLAKLSNFFSQESRNNVETLHLVAPGFVWHELVYLSNKSRAAKCVTDTGCRVYEEYR